MASVVTLTLNPSVDVATSVVDMVADRKLRCTVAQRDPGGGGINVARVVRTLGGHAEAIWTRGGPTGTLLSTLLERERIEHREIFIEEDTRENVTVTEERSGSQYRFVLPGPSLSTSEVQRVFACVRSLTPVPRYFVLSGSLPRGAAPGLYAELVTHAPQGAQVVVDTSGDPLRAMQGAGVFLIKPNLRELADLTNERLESERSIVAAARRLIDEGTTHAVFVSMGARGALIVTRDLAAQLRAPPVRPVSRVGAGDSTVGGLLYALSSGRDLVSAARYGVAAGTAAVLTPGSALCTKEDTERLYEEVGL